MLKIKYYNRKRQSGKTTDLIKLFNEDPENSFYITFNQDSVNLIKKNVQWEHHNRLCTFDNVENKLIGRRVKRIFIDEYDYIRDKATFNHCILAHLSSDSDCEIVIMTTPFNTYSKNNFIMAKLIKDLPYLAQKEYMSMLNLGDKVEVETLLNSLITHKSTELFDSSIQNNYQVYSKSELTGEMFT